MDDKLNPYTIGINLYTDNSVNSLYILISRSIITTNNNKIILYNNDSTKQIINETQFINVFKYVYNTEFPEKNNANLILENKDAQKLVRLKQAFKGNKFYKCEPMICEYLDKHLLGWR
jgi:hypothetical protein